MRKLLLAFVFLASMAQAQILGPIFQKPTAAAPPTTVTAVVDNNCIGYVTGTSASCVYGGVVSVGQALALVISIQDTTVTGLTICDDTAGTCAGAHSTYTQKPAYVNGSNFQSIVFYTCNFAGDGALHTVNMGWTGSSTIYVVGIVATGNSTTNCEDGYARNQGTGTAYSTGANTITTTNANDLVIGFPSNWIGGTFTAGNDGQGHTMTLGRDQSGVVAAEYYNESSTAAYGATATGPSGAWNMEVLAIK